MATKMSSKEITKAIAEFAKKHGYYCTTVRQATSLRLAAIAEYVGR